MSESKPAGIEHTKKTLAIKKIQGQDLTIDVYYTSSAASTPRPAILFFHGGFLVLNSSLLPLTTKLTHSRYQATPTRYQTGFSKPPYVETGP